jgi:hypothetical protein
LELLGQVNLPAEGAERKWKAFYFKPHLLPLL